MARALAEPARVEILLLLFRDGPSDITTLSEKLSQDRSVVSRHLKLLHGESLVKLTRSGRQRIYRIDAATILRRVDAIAANLRAVIRVCCPDEFAAPSA